MRGRSGSVAPQLDVALEIGWKGDVNGGVVAENGGRVDDGGLSWGE